MKMMFMYAQSFDRDLSAWDTGKVTDTSSMFVAATAFNGDVSSWDVSQVTDMTYKFFYALKFNGDISSWNVAKATEMVQMFDNAKVFNQDLCEWTDKFDAWSKTANMFKGTNCTFPADPAKDKNGPFCAATCQTATVVWSTVSCCCSVNHCIVV